MNTDQPDNNPQQVNEPVPAPNPDQSLSDLVGALQSVDTTTPEDSLNATSIEDNNGGRIELNQDEDVIKK